MPTRLLKQGVTDMVRISDGRMSGTGFGTVVLHVAPEAAVGGPLALVRTGDRITARRAGADDLTSCCRRRGARPSRGPRGSRRRPTGDRRLHAGSTASTSCRPTQGADFDFLRRLAAARPYPGDSH